MKAFLNPLDYIQKNKVIKTWETTSKEGDWMNLQIFFFQLCQDQTGSHCSTLTPMLLLCCWRLQATIFNPMLIKEGLSWSKYVKITWGCHEVNWHWQELQLHVGSALRFFIFIPPKNTEVNIEVPKVAKCVLCIWSIIPWWSCEPHLGDPSPEFQPQIILIAKATSSTVLGRN